MRRLAVLGSTTIALAVAAGCTQKPPRLLTNDPSLRKPSVELAADAVKRSPFKADAPRGGEAVARAQVGYSLNVLEITNLSDTDWNDVEIWVNREYVVHLPVMERAKLKRIPFLAIFNDSGKNFPTNNRTDLIRSVELYRDGQMYDVRMQLAD
jgi:hypothetical protein